MRDGPEAEVAPAAARRWSAWAPWALGAAFFIAALGACQVYSGDAPMHLAHGRWIVEHRAIPDPQEFLCVKNPGLAYKDRWLFQVSCWIVYSVRGWTGLTLVKILALLATFAFLWRAARPAGPLACAAATFCAAMLMYERWDIRSELGVYFFASAALALIPVDEEKPGRSIWLLPLVALVGINFHSVVLAVPALAIAASVASLVRPATRARAPLLAAVAGLCLLACLANPQGWRVFTVPWEYMHRYRTGPDWYRGFITELAPATERPTWPPLSLYAIWILPPAAAVAVAVNWKRFRAFDAILLVLGGFAAFSIRRNISLSGFLLFPVVARNFHEVGAAWMTRLRERGFAEGSTWLPRAAAAAVGVAMAIAAALSTSDLWAVAERSSRRAGFGVNRDAMPLDAAEFLNAKGFSGNAFTNWDAGGAYTLVRFPASVPSMNGEGDASLVTLEEYDRVTRGEISFDDHAAKYGIEIAFLTHQSGDTQFLIERLLLSPTWGLVYRDGVAVVFARRAGPNAALIPREPPDPPLRNPFASRAPWPWGEGSRRSEAVAQGHVGSMYSLFRDPRQQACFAKALALWPEYPEGHQRLGVFFAGSSDPRAEAEFREASRLAPKYVPPRRNMAILLEAKNDLDGAERELEEGLEEVEDADLLTDLAALERYRASRSDGPARRASLEKAAAYLRRALIVRPSNSLARKALEEVRTQLK